MNKEIETAEQPLSGDTADKRPKKGFWAPGDYQNKCLDCGERFIGDKRAAMCANCAYTTLPIRKAKQIKLVKEGEQTVMPLEDGEWIMMDAPEDGYVIKMGGGNIGVFITQSELNEECYVIDPEEGESK